MLQKLNEVGIRALFRGAIQTGGNVNFMMKLIELNVG